MSVGITIRIIRGRVTPGIIRIKMGVTTRIIIGFAKTIQHE
jgi:hypothetical protein